MNEDINIENEIATNVPNGRAPDSILRISVRSMYDMQTLRIQNGNRICAAFRVKLGLTSSQAEETDKEANKLLDDLRAEFKRITDGVKRITKTFKSDSQLITTRSELALLESYERSLEAEKIHEKAIAYELSFEPIWTEFLEPHVRGVGVLMAGVIVSEVDIHKCNSISALYAYCGLDVVTVTDKITGEVRSEGRCRQPQHLVDKVYITSEGEEKHTKGISFNPLLKTKMVGVLGGVFLKMGGSYKAIYDGYKHRLENHPEHRDSWSIVHYTALPAKDKDGKPTTVDKIHEVIVKYYIEDECKLAWSGYAAKYSPDPASYKMKRTGKTKGHRHNMAIRYMVKEFLADLWTEWRKIEGLPVRSTYAEEKLGIVHSKTGVHSWQK